MASTSTTTLTLTQPPVAVGESVQQRLAGPKPVVAVDAQQLTFVLDPSGRAAASNRAALAAAGSGSGADARGNLPGAALWVRQGRRPLAALTDAGPSASNAAGSALLVGDAAAGSNTRAATFLSLRTPPLEALGEADDGAHVERLRVGPGGAVTVAPNARLDVACNAAVGGVLHVLGGLVADRYVGLVDDYRVGAGALPSAAFTPPTADALAGAFAMLSNMVATSTYGFTYAGAGAAGMSNADWLLVSRDEDAVATGPLACASLYVAPDGCVSASSYCNLPVDYTTSDPTRPASAFALAAAYAQLSNFVVAQVRDARFEPYLPPPDFSAFTLTQLQGDLWLRSAPDGLDRLLLPSAPGAPVLFGASAGADVLASDGSLASSDGGDAFGWLAANAAPNARLMTLSHRGDLDLAGGLTARGAAGATVLGGDVRVASNAADGSGGWLRADGGASLGGALSLTGTGGVSVAAGGLSVAAGGLSVGRGDVVVGAGDVVVPAGSLDAPAGFVRAAAYCNLPVATSANGSQGVVWLASALVPGAASNIPNADDKGFDDLNGGSNTAASTALVAAVGAADDARGQALRELYEEAIYSMYLASNMASAASNVALQKYLLRGYDEPDAVPGITLTNLSTDPGASVRLLFGVGVGPEPAVLWESMASNSAYLPDPVGSNCASLSVSASNPSELVMAGAPSTLVAGPPCSLAIGRSVDVRAGPAVAAVLPPDMASNVLATDPSDPVFAGAVFTAAASSLYAPDFSWCQAYQGFAGGPGSSNTDGLAWMSAAGTYDSASGYPTAAAATTDLADGTSVRGEWLQFTAAPTGMFVSRATLVIGNANYVPDDLVLLASPTDPLGATGAAWRIVSPSVGTSGVAAALRRAGAGGVTFSLPSAAQATRFAAVRLVVTRVALTGTFALFADLAQVEALKLRGSVFAPAPDLLLTVDETALTVDVDGNVGLGTATPAARLHFGGLQTVAASADARGAATLVVLDAPPASSDLVPEDPADAGYMYRGWALAPDALVQRVEPRVDHAWAAGATELARLGGDGSARFLHGNVSAAAPGVVSGSVAVTAPPGAVRFVRLATLPADAAGAAGGQRSFTVQGSVARGAEAHAFEAVISLAPA